MKSKMEIIVKTKATITAKKAWGPAPTTMGIGPIRIIPPKLTVPSDKKIENSMKIIPRKINRKPRKTNLTCVSFATFSPRKDVENK